MDTIGTERGTVAGGISVIIILITLCISMYGLLSLFAARNELGLNRKNKEAAEDYYAADAAAAVIISEIDAFGFTAGGSYEFGGASVLYDAESGSASFTVPVDKFRELEVAVSFPEGGSYLRIDKYRVASSIDWHEHTQEGVIIFTGTED